MMTVRGVFLLWVVLLSASFAPGRADLPEVIWGEKIEVASAGGYRGPWHMNESLPWSIPRKPVGVLASHDIP